MKKLMHLMMLSCKKVTELIEKKSLVGLNWKEKIQFTMHTSMCDACSTYQKQSEFLDKILYQQNITPYSESVKLVENKALKERIISSL